VRAGWILKSCISVVGGGPHLTPMYPVLCDAKRLLP
jgi:hypothetical protein